MPDNFRWAMRTDGDRRLCLRHRQQSLATIPALVLVEAMSGSAMVSGIIAAGIAGATLASRRYA